MKKALILCLLLLFAGLNTVIIAQTAPLAENPWHFLDTQRIGAHDFLKAHPTYDGRGVVVLICDSGVDMGVPGLLKTSDGKVKVIDARDFSGQGDISLMKAKLDSSDMEVALKAKNVRVTGFGELPHQPADSVYWLGWIDEARHFKNASIRDINHNGKKDDIFAFITFPVPVGTESRWVYYLDEDADGNLQDEKPRFNYKFNYDSFTLRGRDLNEKKALLTFTLQICGKEKTAVFHACDNSHGTHCAGISTGFQLFGEPTQHGIAPGAQVISCKIGDGSLSGGATTTGSMKAAYEFGAKWAEENNTPVVFSMSYGIGSELEGRSDIEKYLNKLVQENPNIVIVTSNGNSGPGLSSAGNPACARNILSVGAMLPHGSARDSYGFANDGDRVFHFSSRGGEVNKPDCLAPGCAASAVPRHARGENMWGTSMACPQVSGAAAVLISACRQEKIPFNGALIQRALKYSALPLPGYTALDQGTGVVNIPRAFEIMKIFARRQEQKKMLNYEIKTLSPVFPDEHGPAAYWRAGNYIPPITEKQIFTVKARFPESLSADEKANFYRAYNLKTDQPWLRIDKKSTYIRGEHSAKIGVSYQTRQLKNPGLYVGKIVAYPKSGPGQDIPEFELLNTVIVPHNFSAAKNYQLTIRQKKLKSGTYHRYFVQVPAGATSMTIQLAPVRGKYCGVYGYVYNPAGQSVARLPLIDPQKNAAVRVSIAGKALIPGVWEVIPFAFHNQPRTSTYELKVNCDGLKITPAVLTGFDFEAGKSPKANLKVTNQFRKFEGTVNGQIRGYSRTQTCEIDDDLYKHHFHVDDTIEQVRLTVGMTPETWNLFTDVAVNVKNKDGKIEKSSGMNQRSVDVNFKPLAPGKYTLEILAGFTHPRKQHDSWEIEITEKYFLTEKIKLHVTKNGKKKFDLYPGLPADCEISFEKSPRKAPVNFRNWGELEFIDENRGCTAKVPVLLQN